ncbi:MAG: tRNA (guanosine(37)-N1)-methyltransferase TrmD, partial [Alphaproteobacteria bacterium]|nr:tRNA (guanosine(37)-N1)-methyltransferase TrmD [Alphaproteobacteria bacterium]
MRALVLTLFPEMFPGPLGLSLAGKALAAGLWELQVLNPRDFATDRHQTVDDKPYGGGTGMVMRADVLGRALDHARNVLPQAQMIYLSPRGEALKQ